MKFREVVKGIIREENNIKASQLPRSQDRQNEAPELGPKQPEPKSRKEAANHKFDTWRRSKIDAGGFLAIEAEDAILKTAKHVRSRGNPQQEQRYCAEYHFGEDVHPGKRKKCNKRGHLLTREKVQIVHKVLIQLKTQTEVAKEHRISNQVVCILIKKVKSKAKYLEELSNKDNEVREKRKKIAEHILLLNKADTFLDSIGST
jgi:hypothetical protein